MSQPQGDAAAWRARREALRRDSGASERPGQGESGPGQPSPGQASQGEPKASTAYASQTTQTVQTVQNPPEPPDDDPYGDDVEPERPRGFWRSLLAGIRELIIVIVLAMALSFVVKTWLFQAFYIPSGSMEDTLVRDDRVIVSKLTPGPFDLRRGDVVVFEDPGTPTPWLSGQNAAPSTVGGPFHNALVFIGLLPEDSENHLIKRVIGLPGDRVQADGTSGKISVNGVPITESYIKPGDAPSEGKAFNIVVPAGKVWVMGDHRSDSADSRFHDDDSGGVDGSVPMDKIVGRALFIVWPIDHVTWLGVPERTFEQVPNPASPREQLPAVKPSAKPAVKPSAKPAVKPAPKVTSSSAKAG